MLVKGVNGKFNILKNSLAAPINPRSGFRLPGGLLTTALIYAIIYAYKGVEQMKRSTVRLKKQPQRYLSKANSGAYARLRKALDDLEEWKGDIVKLKNSDYYRLKIPHYRIIFTYDGEINIIYIEEINTRSNISYRRYSK
jgi:mRNA-degrading endonuclease RelE of RelBE toxin-antitoxin system